MLTPAEVEAAKKATWFEDSTWGSEDNRHL